MRVPDSATGKTKEVRVSGFATKVEAQADRRVKELEAQEGRYVTSTKLTVEDFFEDWFRVKVARGEIKFLTAENYRQNLHTYIFPLLGSVALQDLTVEKLESFLIHLGQKGKKDGSALSRSTVRGVAITLSQGLDRAVKLRKIVSNPMSQVEIPKGQTKTVSGYSAQEVKKLLMVAQSHRLYALFHLASHTGARRGEILALRWTDFNSEKGFISISKTRGMIHEGNSTKTKNGMRVVELDPETIQVLHGHKKKQNLERFLLGEAWRDSGYIFVQEDGEPIYPSTAYSVFCTLAKRAELDHAPFHSLRHTHATTLLRSGIPAYIVAKRLGDEVQTVLKTYAHALREDDHLSALTFAEKIANA
jgi:integrase